MDQSVSRYLWGVLFSLEALLIIFSNITSVVIFVRKYRHLRTNILLINLSIADLLAGLFVVNMAIDFYTLKPVSNMLFYCSSNNVLASVLGFAHQGALESVATLALIALERAFAVIKPLQHRVLKRKYYRCSVILTWFLTALPNVMTYVIRCNSPFEILAYSAGILLVSLSLVIMIMSYAAIYIKLRFYPVFQHNASTQMQMRLLKTLFTTTVASAGTLSPFGVYSLYCKYYGLTVDENVYNFTLLLAFSNSFINFLVYAWKMPEFGREIEKIICFCRKANPSVNEEHGMAARESVVTPKTVRQANINQNFDAN